MNKRENVLLHLLKEHGELAGRKLAEFSGYSYGYVYPTMRILEDRGLVSHRDAFDEDGRLRFFSITTKGMESLL